MLAAWGSMDPGHYPSKRALEASYFGRFHRCQRICDVGSMWYGHSLKKLARDLDDPKEMLSLSVLRSAVVLTMYEVRLAPSTSSSPPMHRHERLRMEASNFLHQLRLHHH